MSTNTSLHTVEQNDILGYAGTLECTDLTDADGNPTGGGISGPGFAVCWQHGPRGLQPGSTELMPATGAFVEDLIVAARHRLSFFQQSKFECGENELAIHHLSEALAAMGTRRADRAARGVEGRHEL